MLPSHLQGMGTALQHAVDFLAILPKNYNVYSVNSSIYLDFVENKFFNNTLTDSSMDRMLEQYNRDSVRMAMLKHEEIFKEQVRELHRLYKVQKMLMVELIDKSAKIHSPTASSSRLIRAGGKCTNTDNRNQTGFWTTATTSENNQAHLSSWNSFSNQPNSGHNFHPLFSMRADPSLQKQSSSCSRDTCKAPKGFDLEQPAEEISTDINATSDQVQPNALRYSRDTTKANSSHNPCFYNKGDSEVELTLSIGFGTSKKNPKNRKPQTSQELGCSNSNSYERRQLDPSLSVRSDRGEECNDSPSNTGSANPACDQESLQQPPWIFNALSLNRT